jgi:PhnB protein
MRLVPYLGFNDQCAEAFHFYEKVLGGTLQHLMTFGDMPDGEKVPAGMENRVVHARLLVGDAVLMGGDSPSEHFKAPQGICVNIWVDDVAESERIFAELSEGGMITMPIGETFWADRFGMVIDRFGTPWMVNCGDKA